MPAPLSSPARNMPIPQSINHPYQSEGEVYKKIIADYFSRMTGNVKGCKTPALSRRPVSLNESSTGRCLTSLEGGNRGMLRCGHFSVQGYGDLNVVLSVRIDRATDY